MKKTEEQELLEILLNNMFAPPELKRFVDCFEKVSCLHRLAEDFEQYTILQMFEEALEEYHQDDQELM